MGGGLYEQQSGINQELINWAAERNKNSYSWSLASLLCVPIKRTQKQIISTLGNYYDAPKNISNIGMVADYSIFVPLDTIHEAETL